MLCRRDFLASAAALQTSGRVSDLLVSKAWRARWVHPPNADLDDYGVFYFRNTFSLDTVPASLPIAVSADSRYRLFVNGVSVATGPARGDLNHWRFETVNLAPNLKQGNNTLAILVWNDGPHAALAQWSYKTGLVIQSEESQFDKLLNTGTADWRVIQGNAHEAIPVPTYQLTGYYAIGPCESFDCSKQLWDWEKPEFDHSTWPKAEAGRNAAGRDARDSPTRWMLVPRLIPMMEETQQKPPSLRSVEGLSTTAGSSPLVLPPNSKITILYDQGYLTTAYPILRFEGGKGARLALAYTEGLYQTMKPRRVKGNRNEVEGKTFIGFEDRILPDGPAREWSPLYWRTFRYLRLTVETGDQPLRLMSLSSIYTGYPFTPKAKLETGNPFHKRILDTGWRTARLCAHETYMDCPYYEQLQYIGDARIQALVSLYMTGDSRLMKNALELMDSSRTAEGATLSRAPSTLQQYIPPFSLWWIGMVHDYWRYVDDPAYVKSLLPGVRAVLSFYGKYLREDGSLAAMPWWNYVDWVPVWTGGRPPGEPDSMPASIHMQFLLALRYAAELESGVGSTSIAAIHEETRRKVANHVTAVFWDKQRSLYSEDLGHKHFSQHANALAVLADLVASTDAKDLITRVEGDKTLYPCSVYFRYYLDRAMAHVGLGGRYLTRLGTWEYMLREGLTTWAEQDIPESRSDCHAWGASPNVEFFRTTLGIDSMAPGFARVLVAPNPGPLVTISGEVPHPKGLVKVDLKKSGATWSGAIELPQGIEGEFKLGTMTRKLQSGRNNL